MVTMQADLPEPALRLAFDEDALCANWKALDRLSGNARAGAAVKANGYGTGAARASRVLRDAGCRDFFVAHWSEVPQVIAQVPPAQVSVLHGPRNEDDAAFARASGVKPVINSLAQAQRWLASGGGRCDLMVDTGMNRLGVSLGELDHEAVQGLEVDVLLSHLVASEEDGTHNERQREAWTEARGKVGHARASLANSAGIMLGPDYHGDLTRPGIALYGGIARPEMASDIRQVVRPQAAVLQLRDVSAGETIGYNATFTAPRSMRVATIALGYADGYLRCWSGKGVLRARGGEPLPVLGRVSMDLTVIDVAAAPSLGEGDWVEVPFDLPYAAHVSGLSQYELLTTLGRRFGA